MKQLFFFLLSRLVRRLIFSKLKTSDGLEYGHCRDGEQGGFVRGLRDRRTCCWLATVGWLGRDDFQASGLCSGWMVVPFSEIRMLAQARFINKYVPFPLKSSIFVFLKFFSIFFKLFSSAKTYIYGMDKAWKILRSKWETEVMFLPMEIDEWLPPSLPSAAFPSLPLISWCQKGHGRFLVDVLSFWMIFQMRCTTES